MPANITQVSWSASNLPSGIDFSEETGTFSGTPNEAGEYVVPVTVETNYGTDTKNVSIIVEPSGGKVYALGTRAAVWSDGSDPIEYGFRKVDMPDAGRLTFCAGGFCARANNGDWYVAGVPKKGFAVPKLDGSGHTLITTVYPDFNPSKPTKFPVPNVVEFGSGIGPIGQTQYLTSGNIYFTSYSQLGDGNYNIRSSDYTGNIKKLSQDCIYTRSVRLIYTDDEGYKINSCVIPEGVVIKKFGAMGGTSLVITYLTTDGKLYKGNDNKQIYPEYGNIKDYWFLCVYNNGYKAVKFIQTSDGKLYAAGDNTSYKLGLPQSKEYSDFELVGEYSAKKITSSGGATFMLTTEGKLYHTGQAKAGITDAHTTFTPIFEDLTFQDVIYISTTLVVTIKEEE